MVEFILRFTSIYFDITLNGIQNFIEKYQHMSTLQAVAMYNDVPHVKISNDVATSVYLKVPTLRRYALVMSLNPLTIYLIKPLHWIRIQDSG